MNNNMCKLFSICKPIEKIKIYTTILKNDYKFLNKHQEISEFFMKYFLVRDIDTKWNMTEMYRDYVKINNKCCGSNNGCYGSNYGDMTIIKPFYYAQLMNPVWINNTNIIKDFASKYNFYDPIYYTKNIVTDRIQVIDYRDEKNIIERMKQNSESQEKFIKNLLNIEIEYEKLNMDNYLKFLNLIKKNAKKNEKKNITFVPTIEIDLFWHVHMLEPDIYKKDCIKNFGYILDHNDKVSDHDISDSNNKTHELWLKEYGTGMCTGDAIRISRKNNTHEKTIKNNTHDKTIKNNTHENTINNVICGHTSADPGNKTGCGGNCGNQCETRCSNSCGSSGVHN